MQQQGSIHDSEFFNECGKDAYTRGDFSVALEHFIRAIRDSVDPVSKAKYLSNRAAVYMQLREYDRVVEDTTDALQLDTMNVKCLLRRAIAWEQLEKFDQALAGYRTVIDGAHSCTSLRRQALERRR